jgi:hypothetical protein
MTKLHYIETIGLPGSGKTEAGKLLVKCLGEKDIPAMQRSPLRSGFLRRIRIIIEATCLLLTVPALWQFWLSPLQGDYGKVPQAWTVLRGVRWRLILEAVIVREMLEKDQIVLVNDEGIIGKVVVLSLLVNMPEEKVVRILNKLLPPETAVVYLNTPAPIAINRVATRNTPLPFFDDMTKEVKTKFYRHNGEVYDRVCQKLKAVRNMTTVSMQNTGSAETLKSELDIAVQSFFNSYFSAINTIKGEKNRF